MTTDEPLTAETRSQRWAWWFGKSYSLGLAGAAAGYAGSWLVWMFIYAIGARVVSDEIHYEYHDTVVRCGAAAGACSGFVLGALPRYWPLAALALLHFMTLLNGAFAVEATDWRGGLIGYFGTHAVGAAACLCFSVTPFARRLRHS